MEDGPRFRPRIKRMAAATRAPLARRASDDRLQPVQPRLTWARRIGVVAVVLVLGVVVVLASGFGNGSPQATPAASLIAAASPTEVLALTEAPEITGPDTVYTKSKNWNGRVSLVPTVVPRDELTLRVIRNGEQVRDVDLSQNRTMSVPGVQLKMGDNQISVAYVWNGAAGPTSNTVTVTRDGTAPSVDVSSPLDGSITAGGKVTVAGRTESGTSVRVRNATVGSAANADADPDGAFSVDIVLVTGPNTITVSATDTAGNTTTVQRSITRDPEASDLLLDLSHKSLQLRNLPVTLDITAQLTTSLGPRADGSAVTFSLSPPGVPTSTYQTTITSERATWSPQVPAGAQAGSGFATAKVTLPDSTVVQATALFTVR